MLFNTILFHFFSAIAVGSAILMITRRNIVHGAVFLVTALLATAGIFLQLQSEFLFIAQVFLCAGGTVVLFVFVIMLLGVDMAAQLPRFKRPQFIATALALVLAAQMLFAVFVGRGSLRLPAWQGNIAPRNTDAIGDALFHQFVVPFEVAAILLLVAMIGAVMIARRNA
jgi:NADH-quinone oxidoreductase subunit J